MRNVTTAILVMISFTGILLLVEAAESYDDTVYQVQKKLIELGYHAGSPDGILGWL
ncbi:MAG: hypothetical protein JSW07_07370 [bacterium]|nr:MAG: hypothetical protein JSW07_07370 [bacterium]